MYFKFLFYLINAHIHHYRRYKFYEKWIKSARRPLNTKLKTRKYSTLAQITAENLKFEQEHPEYFPGLQKSK